MTPIIARSTLRDCRGNTAVQLPGPQVSPMQFTLIQLPIAQRDAQHLQELVRAWDPFLTASIAAEDPYSILAHVRAGEDPEFRLHALFDRNLISCVGRLAAGRSVPAQSSSAETYRVAAGCMAYFILGQALVDPSLATHEFADRHGSDEANLELQRFRVADHVHPTSYVDIALGRASRVAPEHLEEARSAVAAITPPEAAHDFSLKLRDLTIHQVALTKIAILAREKGSGRQKVERYLQWCYDDALLNAAAHVFALIYFGNRNRGGMLKGVGSSSLDSIKRGVRNAAWDLVYLSHWARQAKVDDPSVGWLFCSRDIALMEIARFLAAPGDVESPHEALLALHERNWAREDAHALLGFYMDLLSRIDGNPEAREAHMRGRPTAAKLLRDLELELAASTS